jgi:hypothetical protein
MEIFVVSEEIIDQGSAVKSGNFGLDSRNFHNSGGVSDVGSPEEFESLSLIANLFLIFLRRFFLFGFLCSCRVSFLLLVL